MSDDYVILRAHGITKTFGQGEAAVRAVDNVDLTVRAGQLALIMGPSGSGKTTLLTILGGLLRPTSGTVVVDGADITALSEAQLGPVRRQKVGFIFQSFNLWESLSVLENVELPMNIAGFKGRPARDRARKLLTGRGLDQKLGVRTRDLSGGEKQRVSISRALANEPRLVLADEPTANLDSRNGREVMTLLRGIANTGDRAVVAVSHDQRIREVADFTLWLEDGRLRNMGKVVRDPICGMGIEADRAFAAEFGGTVYHFCSRGCCREFQAEYENAGSG